MSVRKMRVICQILLSAQFDICSSEFTKQTLNFIYVLLKIHPGRNEIMQKV